jgi:hypothetical protein
MNPHLALLLSAVYSGSLAPEHLSDLRKSGLTDATIAVHRIRSVPPAMIRPLLGFDSPIIRSALLFPFLEPGGGFMDHVRMKIFPPLTDAEGHAIKYLQPKHSHPRLYFTMTATPERRAGVEAVWLCEGEKKSLAVAQLGLPAVGIAGVEGWHRRGERSLLPDFDHIRLPGRVIELVPDGDIETNPYVRRAVRRFGDALLARGARPCLVRLPAVAGVKCGVDDFIQMIEHRARTAISMTIGPTP